MERARRKGREQESVYTLGSVCMCVRPRQRGNWGERETARVKLVAGPPTLAWRSNNPANHVCCTRICRKYTGEFQIDSFVASP
eukprot:6207610-Pleurochrysis_carterae.AAC.1